MKTGSTLEEISAKILKERPAKKDYVADSSQFKAVARDTSIDLTFQVSGEARVYTPTPLCLGQIADRVGIPAKYASKMREKAPHLLAENINHWFKSEPSKRMLRTLDNGTKVARAFLSDAYRPLDNYDLMEAVLPHAGRHGCRIQSCEITETRLYVQAVSPRLESVIEQEVKVGGHRMIKRTIQAGVVISNSEVGGGSVKVEPLLFDLVCTNGLILPRVLQKSHVGRRADGAVFGDADTYELFSDETRQLDDKAFWSKVNDVVASAFDSVRFHENVDKLRKAQTVQLADDMKSAEAVIDITAKRNNLTVDEGKSMLLHLVQGGDFSLYGLSNAVTRAAEDVESYDRAIELERLGGQVLELKASDFSHN